MQFMCAIFEQALKLLFLTQSVHAALSLGSRVTGNSTQHAVRRNSHSC